MSEKMDAIVKTEPKLGGTEFRSVPIPELEPNSVLIKTKIASICGTDVHIYDWNAWAASRIKLPRVYGHEFAGEVIEVGKNVSSIKVGDYVSGECHIACGYCNNCKTGLAHICRHTQIFGVDIDGIFAEYACIPETNVWKNDPELPLELATIQDPLGNAIHTVFSGDIAGRTVAIVGCGPIGLMAVALCKMLGASQVFAIGRRNEYRLNLAKKLGADRTIKSSVEDPVKIIIDSTDGFGVDVVLEMSGSAVALNQSFKYLRPGGSIYILGLYAQDVPIDVSNDIVFKYARVVGINGRLMFDTWYRMAGLLKSGTLNLEPIITHKFKFDEFERAMETMRSGNSGKVVLYMS
jgi:threonine 3-dehydrogenase